MICDMLIVGGDGDLAFRKLYPALFQLDVEGCLPDCLKIISVSRRQDGQEAFRQRVYEALEKYVEGSRLSPQQWATFQQRLFSYSVDATNEAQLAVLVQGPLSDSSRDLIVYLATPPAIFAPVCQSLWAVGLVRPNMRLVIEKPLGHHRASFLQINQSLMTLFNESQVYRIDHYLGKETVQNLLALRFGNALFEPLWNNTYIDHVQITAAETVGVGGRWSFYDEAGALRDMVQNHLLQLLCLLAMEPPASLDARAVHDEKLKVLRSLKPITGDQAEEYTVRGQYQAGSSAGSPVPGYMEEEGADSTSDTETFVAIKAHINNWRWSGVPFYIRTGKRMARRFSEIVVQFKELPHAIFPQQAGLKNANRLVITLQPEESIRLHLLNKVPGLEESFPLEAVSLDLSLSEAFTDRRAPEAYERLLLDVMRGNSALFMDADQVEVAWSWVDGIRASWAARRQKPVAYPAGSYGPVESVALLARDGRQWQD